MTGGDVSSYMVIRSVSEAPRRILWDAVAADDTTREIVGSPQNIVFVNPTQTALDTSRRRTSPRCAQAGRFGMWSLI